MARYDRNIKSGGHVSIGRRIVFIGIAVVVGVALLTGGVLLLRHPKSSDQTTASSSNTSVSSKKTDAAKKTTDTDTTKVSTPTAPDPSTIKQLEIAQLNVVLGYSNTLPGMSYSIGKTTAGTTYVQLANDQLIGDKCTDDEGVFATILKDPSSTDNTTVSTTVKVGNDTYGLALPSDACTADQDLFDQYQTSMKQNFPFLTASTTATTTSTSTSDTTEQ